MHPERVVIVTGPPGAGKTSVAAALAAQDSKSVHMESDCFFRWIRSGFVAPVLPESHDQNTAVMDIMADAAAGYADAGYVTYLDGIVGPWFLDRVVRRLRSSDVDVHYLVLRPDRATAVRRVVVRDGQSVDSGADVMYGQFADVGEYENHVVDSGDDIAVVVAACRSAIDAGRFRLDNEI